MTVDVGGNTYYNFNIDLLLTIEDPIQVTKNFKLEINSYAFNLYKLGIVEDSSTVRVVVVEVVEDLKQKGVDLRDLTTFRAEFNKSARVLLLTMGLGLDSCFIDISNPVKNKMT